MNKIEHNSNIAAFPTPMQTGRQRKILELLHQGGERSVDALAELLQVSDMTIRRDLQALAEEGLLLRTHGGASPVENVRFEFQFLQRAQHRRQQKEAIGLAAAAIVKEGQSVLFDSGTTTLAVARQLRRVAHFTVITTSLPIASVMQRSGNADILLLGGFLRRDSPDLEGPITESNLNTLHADVAFLGADGVDGEGNVYNASLSIARLLMVAVKAASKVYVVADSSKLDRNALTKFGNLRDWAGLVTDAEISHAQLTQYRQAGINVIVAPKDLNGVR